MVEIESKYRERSREFILFLRRSEHPLRDLIKCLAVTGVSIAVKISRSAMRRLRNDRK